MFFSLKNKVSHSGDSPKWVKSKRRRERKERKRERPKVGNNNGQLRITMPPRAAHTKPPGLKCISDDNS